MNATKKELKALNHQVDCQCPCFKEVKAQLPLDSLHLLPFDNKVLTIYILGKFHLQLFLRNGGVEHLEMANENFDHLFILAFDAKRLVKNPKYWFRRIKTKYLLSFYLDSQSSYSLKNRSTEILETAIDLFPNNEQLLWLKSQVDLGQRP